MPAWVSAGYLDYARRMPPELSLKLVEVAMAHRGKNPDIPRLMQRESDALVAATQPKDRVVALEVGGRPWSTEELAAQLENWRQDGRDVNFLVGGPDGLADDCRQRADQRWSLSPLTLPHPLVRIVLAEQLYRAWSITRNHPYHRA
jgi:23S rRNA (pseudouridine1915-N3)-methyltransferase